MKAWDVLSSRYLIKRWWMNLRVDRVRMANGSELDEFHVIEYPDWACVVCLDEDGQMIMVRQYRHGVGATLLECPAGAIGAGEEPLEAARRELLEETGHEAPEWIYLGRCAAEPSKHTNYAYLFVARRARRVQAQRLDETEDIAVHRLAPEEVLQRAEAGEVLHGIHLAALLWARQRNLLVPGPNGAAE